MKNIKLQPILKCRTPEAIVAEVDGEYVAHLGLICTSLFAYTPVVSGGDESAMNPRQAEMNSR
jgi:hypothetical protein